jgi:hypothetical protein
VLGNCATRFVGICGSPSRHLLCGSALDSNGLRDALT